MSEGRDRGVPVTPAPAGGISFGGGNKGTLQMCRNWLAGWLAGWLGCIYTRRNCRGRDRAMARGVLVGVRRR